MNRTLNLLIFLIFDQETNIVSVISIHQNLVIKMIPTQTFKMFINNPTRD